MSGAGQQRWSTVAPFPPARPYDLDADPRAALQELVRDVAWADADWGSLLQSLTTVGRSSIPGGRLAEGHIDAVRILHQAGRSPVPAALYGVWASRSRGGGPRIDVRDGQFCLTGTIPFASGAGLIDRALVSALTPEGTTVLVDAAVREWSFDESSWQTSAMLPSRSFTVTVHDESLPRDAQVGPDGFYLDRPGFFPGGVGVAAVWAGGAARVADLLEEFLSTGSPLAGPQQGHLGRITTELAAIGSALELAGLRLPAVLETPPMDTTVLQRFSTEVRAVVGAAVRRLLDSARAAAGPAGIAQHPGLGAAIADLDLYVRQQPADRDAEYLSGRSG